MILIYSNLPLSQTHTYRIIVCGMYMHKSILTIFLTACQSLLTGQYLRDYVASTIHLRAVLHAQPSFSHALSALKMVRCSMKFKEEKAQLKKEGVPRNSRIIYLSAELTIMI